MTPAITCLGAEEDGIRESRQDLPSIGAIDAPERVRERRILDLVEGAIDDRDQLHAQPGSFRFVPLRGLGEFLLGLAEGRHDRACSGSIVITDQVVHTKVHTVSVSRGRVTLAISKCRRSVFARSNSFRWETKGVSRSPVAPIALATVRMRHCRCMVRVDAFEDPSDAEFEAGIGSRRGRAHLRNDRGEGW